MKIYTKRGDKGETSLYGGVRVSKDIPRIEAYGNVDEANSALGLALSFLKDEELQPILKDIQNDLFIITAELSNQTPTDHIITMEKVTKLEHLIDSYEEKLPKLTKFILPSGSQGGAALHLARTVVRRAERSVVALKKQESVRDEPLVYLNRLSDLLFVLSRYVNKQDGKEENSPTY